MLSALVIPGCGVSSASPNRTQFWGRVTYNGQPLSDGAVIFMPAERNKSNWGAGHIDTAGRFSLSAYQTDSVLEPGRYNIFFRPPGPKFGVTKAKRSEDEETGSKQAGEPQAVSATPGFALPDRFTNPTTSGLVITVDGRPQRIDLDLKD
jgi:hypothetical protein